MTLFTGIYGYLQRHFTKYSLAVSSNKGDQYSSAKKASLPRRPAATLNFLDSTSCRLPINKNELLQQKVDVERSFLTLMKENKSPMSPQVESNTQVVTPTRSCKKDVSVFSETKQIHASSKRKFGTEILSKKRESVLSMRKKQKLDLGDAEELYFANQVPNINISALYLLIFHM